jgi:hypothetical protein
MKRIVLIPLAVLFLYALPIRVMADADDLPATGCTELFGTLDYRSKYYSDWFPEPFRVEDTAIDNELRFDWEHDEGKGSRDNIETGEIQKSLGIFTLEIQAPYISTTGTIAGDSDDPSVTRSSAGFGNVELGARLPVLQYVSNTGFFDNTIGFNLEAGVPTNSVVSKNSEIVPGVFDDLAVGKRFSVQTLFSFSHVFGSVPTGRESFEYGLAFAYAIEDEDFAIPHVERLIPSIELIGNTLLDGSNVGHNALTGTAGLRAEFKSIGKVQPSLGIGYIFPIDRGGRDELHWGIISSLTLEF